MSDQGAEPEKQIQFLNQGVEIGKNSRHLPHWQLDGIFCFLTWRLADSLPAGKLNEWRREREEWITKHPKPWDAEITAQYRELFPQRIETWLDAGHGSCFLRRPECAAVIAGALHFFDGQRYDLAAYVVMPNHVHVLFQLREGHRLEKVTQSWKGYTARELIRLLLRTGSLWQSESWDTLPRGSAHLERCLSYIHQNPTKAKLNKSEYLLYEAQGFREATDLTYPSE